MGSFATLEHFGGALEPDDDVGNTIYFPAFPVAPTREEMHANTREAILLYPGPVKDDWLLG